MEKLALEIFDRDGDGSKFANLPSNTSITIVVTSELFDSGDIWTYSFRLNVNDNAHIFGSSGEIHGGRLHEQIDKRRARLWALGLPLYYGYTRLNSEVKVEASGDVDIKFESGQKTFRDMIDGAKANQVPLMSDVVIGLAHQHKRFVRFPWLTLVPDYKLESKGYFGEYSASSAVEVYDTEVDGQVNYTASYPRMVYPKGHFVDDTSGSPAHVDVNFLNVDTPYDAEHPFCNIALCYQKYAYPEKNGITDYNAEPERQREYEYMPADRVNSAPCFYVIYWLLSLMKHLGILVTENQMMAVEDLRRLFFVNTRCAYEETNEYIDNLHVSSRYGCYELITQYIGTSYQKNLDYMPEMTYPGTIVDYEGSSISVPNDEEHLKVKINYIRGTGVEEDLPKITSFGALFWNNGCVWDDINQYRYKYKNRYLYRAYATSRCFPDEDIQSVIDMLENAFGVRLLFDEKYQSVRVVLLRNILQSSEVHEVKCEIVGQPEKTDNSIRGFRMTYGAGKEDTAFYYKGFADMLPSKKEIWQELETDTHDYTQWNLDAEYTTAINSVTAFNKICYVTPANGNAYGIKVDKDAKAEDELNPSLFEFAGFMDAEDGNCSGEPETIKEINVGFTPAIMNDVNIKKEQENGTQDQIYALFVDEKMEPRRLPLGVPAGCEESANRSDALYHIGLLYYNFYHGTAPFTYLGTIKPGLFSMKSRITFQLKNLVALINGSFSKDFGQTRCDFQYEVTFDAECHLSEGYRLYLQDNYAPNDDGVSPIETHDWGLTLGIMRGSGDGESGSHINYSYDADDQNGNDTWELVTGIDSIASPDTCDDYGKIFDYTLNGQDDQQDMTGRFSLKLRAEKPNPYFDSTQPESQSNPKYLEITNPKLRKRGLMDQFHKEESYWWRNAKTASLNARMELAQILGIDMTVRQKIGDVTGFVKKLQYSIDMQSGLSDVEVEMWYL